MILSIEIDSDNQNLAELKAFSIANLQIINVSICLIVLFGNPLNIISVYSHSKNSLTEIMKILAHHLYRWTAGSLEKYSEPRGKIENSRVQVTCLTP